MTDRFRIGGEQHDPPYDDNVTEYDYSYVQRSWRTPQFRDVTRLEKSGTLVIGTTITAVTKVTSITSPGYSAVSKPLLTINTNRDMGYTRIRIILSSLLDRHPN